MKNKPKIIISSLTSCEGCQFTLLDLGERLFSFFKKVEVVDFSLIEDSPYPKNKKVDVAFVEGNPITEENVALLKKIREESKILVALGNCAALGGIPEMKNYQGKEKTIRYLYKGLKNVANPDILELDKFVKVDFTVPGCPINGEEFLRFADELISGKIPELPRIPVCMECPYRATPKCFLIRKKICFGPITLAGCKAVCTRNELTCRACRGLLKNVNAKNFLKGMENWAKREDIDADLEIFGVKNDVDKLV